MISNHGALLPTKQCSAGRTGGSSSSAKATPYCGDGGSGNSGGIVRLGPARLMIGEPQSVQKPRYAVFRAGLNGMEPAAAATQRDEFCCAPANLWAADVADLYRAHLSALSPHSHRTALHSPVTAQPLFAVPQTRVSESGRTGRVARGGFYCLRRLKEKHEYVAIPQRGTPQ